MRNRSKRIRLTQSQGEGHSFSGGRTLKEPDTIAPGRPPFQLTGYRVEENSRLGELTRGRLSTVPANTTVVVE